MTQSSRLVIFITTTRIASNSTTPRAAYPIVRAGPFGLGIIAPVDCDVTAGDVVRPES